MTYRIPRKSQAELHAMKGGELVVRALELARRHERMPQARWLMDRYEDTAGELMRRHRLGILSETLCGVLAHTVPGPWTIQPCDCPED